MTAVTRISASLHSSCNTACYILKSTITTHLQFVLSLSVRRVVRSTHKDPPVADGPSGQRIKAAAQQAGDLYKGRKPEDCQQDNGVIKFQLTHPGAPCGEILIYIRAAKTIRRLVSGRAWSASGATIRTWKMDTRRRDRASEDEPAKSDNGRTGADPEEANQTTPPSGSLQRYHYCSA
ncbi:conserved hypothetical protein, partial [Trichinella spiralis]|uniref:hypothetical protein n=1 Tax=Trichinella spiralis TaxID=6334 RepID=UPI0001EFE442